MPEFDGEGNTVCQFWLQGGKPHKDQHRQELAWQEPPWGPPDPTLDHLPALLKSCNNVATALTL